MVINELIPKARVHLVTWIRCGASWSRRVWGTSAVRANTNDAKKAPTTKPGGIGVAWHSPHTWDRHT